MYSAISECSEQQPEENGNFDEEEKKKSVYKCDNAHPYLDVSGKKATCVPSKECANSGRFEYVTDDGKEPLCVSETKCAEIGYKLRVQCLTKQQCESRTFGQADEESHTCV